MNTLPNLPKKYKRKESKIDGLVFDWFYNNYPKSVLLEVKIKGGKILPHQITAINEVNKTKKFKYKFPDMGRRTPADGVVLKEAEAFLVMCNGNKCVATNNDKTFDFVIHS